MSTADLLDWTVRGVVGAIVAGAVLLSRRVREGERKQTEIETRLAAVEKRDPSATFGALRGRIEDLEARLCATQADVAAVKASVSAIERTLHLIHEHLMGRAPR